MVSILTSYQSAVKDSVKFCIFFAIFSTEKLPARYKPCREPSMRYTLTLCCDDLFLIVRTAALANSVRHHQRAALAALNKSRSRHFPVRSSLISVASGRFVLRANRHQYHLLLFVIPETRKLDYMVAHFPCQGFLHIMVPIFTHSCTSQPRPLHVTDRDLPPRDHCSSAV